MKKYFIFWVSFFILFLLFVCPTTNYVSKGIPEYLGRTTRMGQFWLVSHIISGVIIYAIAPFQFSTAFRNKSLARHRLIGKIYILISIYCISTLFISIIPRSLCVSCQPSQYLATTMWLVFLIAAYISIIQKRILLHQQFMISAFICAAYFVVVRIIDNTAMGFFYYVAKNEPQAYLISDLSAWLIPLIIIWTYWRFQNSTIRNKDS